jgi:hypothetical protein
MASTGPRGHRAAAERQAALERGATTKHHSPLEHWVAAKSGAVMECWGAVLWRRHLHRHGREKERRENKVSMPFS